MIRQKGNICLYFHYEITINEFDNKKEITLVQNEHMIRLEMEYTLLEF